MSQKKKGFRIKVTEPDGTQYDHTSGPNSIEAKIGRFISGLINAFFKK